MLGYFLSLFELRRVTGVKAFQVYYTTLEGHFFLSTIVEARSAYEACRDFDTTPGNETYRRTGINEIT